MPTIWNCPYCELETYKELIFCPHCGMAFNSPWRCGNCGNNNPALSNICSKCTLGIKKANPIQETIEKPSLKKDPLSFLGPEHDFAILQSEHKSNAKPKNTDATLIKKLINFINKITI